MYIVRLEVEGKAQTNKGMYLKQAQMFGDKDQSERK